MSANEKQTQPATEIRGTGNNGKSRHMTDRISQREHNGGAGFRSGAASLREFVNAKTIRHEVLVIGVSYLFIVAGAWNDNLLGFVPSRWSHVLELTMATLLLSEISSRVVFTSNRTVGFYVFLVLDTLSLLTVFPFFAGVALARLIRMFYAAYRLVRLLDRMACHRRNPVYLIWLFPFVVPLFAAVVYVLERHTAGSHIHNYAQALLVCLAFSLSLGNVRPASPIAMTLCGLLFLAGVVCIGVVTNWISNRYQVPKLSED